VLLAGAQAAAILTGIWGAALAGLILRTAAPRRWEGVAVTLYLAMGWSGLAFGGAMLDEISTGALVLVLTGGGLYSLGVVFHLWQRLPFHNAIWHGLVLAASVVFYAAILIEVTRHAPGA
jgi:hemolysin III